MFMRTVLAVAGLFLVLGVVCQAQNTDPARTEDKGTYLGLLFAPIPEEQYKMLEHLPRGQGVRVTQVLADSPAARAELQRDDIVLTYNGESVKDCVQFARLIQNDKPNHKVQLTILRDGREKNVEATLTLGPALRIASKTSDPADVPKGVAKPNPPASVSVAATPLEADKMKVTIEYYAEGTGKIRTVVCEGKPAEIDRKVSELPQRERDAVRLALQRIRTLTTPKQVESKKP